MTLWRGCGIFNLTASSSSPGDVLQAVSSGRNMTMTFVTDGSVSYAGFSLLYSQTLTGACVRRHDVSRYVSCYTCSTSRATIAAVFA